MSLRSFVPQERRVLRILIILTIVTRLALAFRPEWRIATRPFNDDAFYLFTVSEHLAHGDGLTADGIHPTNGIQPLVTYLYVPFFAMANGDKLLAIRLCFILIAIFDAIGVYFIAKLMLLLVRRETEEKNVWLRPPIVAAWLWTFLYSIFVHNANGLETGVYATFLLASIYYYARLRYNGRNPALFQWFGLGVLLGFTVLARIDAVFLVIAICGYELFRYRLGGVLSAAFTGATAFLVSCPWWIYNLRTFGNIMPQSGISESMEDVLAENLRRGAIVIGDILSVFFFLPNYDLPAWFHYFWMILMMTIVVWIFRRCSLLTVLRRDYDLSPLLPLALMSTVLIIYYVFFFGAPHFLPRYFHPARILWLLIFIASVPVLITHYRKYHSVKPSIAKRVLILFAFCAVGFSASRYVYYYVTTGVRDLYLTGLWAQQHPNETIGMEQTGTSGYFASNIVNLDGKVNFEALQARQRHDIGAYIIKRDLDYVADWPEIALPMIKSAEDHGAKFTLVDSIDRVMIFKRIR